MEGHHRRRQLHRQRHCRPSSSPTIDRSYFDWNHSQRSPHHFADNPISVVHHRYRLGHHSMHVPYIVSRECIKKRTPHRPIQGVNCRQQLKSTPLLKVRPSTQVYLMLIPTGMTLQLHLEQWKIKTEIWNDWICVRSIGEKRERFQSTHEVSVTIQATFFRIHFNRTKIAQSSHRIMCTTDWVRKTFKQSIKIWRRSKSFKLCGSASFFISLPTGWLFIFFFISKSEENKFETMNGRIVFAPGFVCMGVCVREISAMTHRSLVNTLIL